MDFIESNLNNCPVDIEKKMAILTSCEEVIINTINYAYPKDAGNLNIEIYTGDKFAEIIFTDFGFPFNPLAMEATNIDLPLEERREGGLGILMVKNLMDDVKYERIENKNILKLYKNI